jgi:SPP1 gp7 family putative phage head morphogenesis protein
VFGGKELQRPEPWPQLDQLEDSYETDLVYNWDQLKQKTLAILRLGPPPKGMKENIPLPSGLPGLEEFKFTVEQRAAIMQAMRGFIGAYAIDDDNSPLRRYYGEGYSLGLIQAAHMIGQDRPILDIIKNKEVYDRLCRTGFDLVKDNATKKIVNQILPEIEALSLAGANPFSVAERLKTLFGNKNSDWRRLARTEMTMVAESAKRDEWAAWGIEKVDFVPAPDACPICKALKGTYPINKVPIPGRDTHPHCRCSIRPAAKEQEAPQGEGLADRFEVNSIDDLNPLFTAYNQENPDVLVNGFSSISETSADYFMATWPQRGEFAVSNTRRYDVGGGFHPAGNLVGAMQKIRNKIPLTFNEEYAVESLWHEICHNRAKKYAVTSWTGAARINMEALNQLVARHTYPDFLAKLGGEARFSTEVLENGYGYGVMVKNLHSLLRKLSVDEAAQIKAFENILYSKSYGRVQDNLASHLAKVTGRPKDVLKEILGNLQRFPESFDAAVDWYLG